MGFKSATNTNVNYEINNLIFSSRLEYQTVESIDRNLKFLFSPAPSNILQQEIIMKILMPCLIELKNGLIDLTKKLKL